MARDKLTAKQSLFIKEYLVDLNATQAAIRAGYSKKTAQAISTENLSKPLISEAIKVEMDKRAGRIELTMDRVLLEYKRLALCDIRKAFDENCVLRPVHEWDDETAAAIAGLEAEEIYAGAGESRVNIGRLSKVKIFDKRAALGDIMRHLGGFAKDALAVAVSTPDGPIGALTPDQAYKKMLKGDTE